MITKISFSNIYDLNKEKGEGEIIMPEKTLVDSRDSYIDWEYIKYIVKIIRLVKRFFVNGWLNIVIPQFKCNEEKESILEIQMRWNEKIYTYSLVFYKSELVMESLLEGKGWVFSRMKDNPNFAFDSSYIDNEPDELRYELLKDKSTYLLLPCFTIGKEFIREIKNSIIVDEWCEETHYDFIEKFEYTFPNLPSYNELINKMIKEYGFFTNYEKLNKDNRTLTISERLSKRIDISLSGSGFLWLSKIYPLMVASKKENLLMLSSIPYDSSLHVVIGNALITWYLEKNTNQPVGILNNIIL